MKIENYGLDTMRGLMNRLGNPEDSLRIIHIAGTNGKGSTVAFLAAILESAGYKVGAYTSPALGKSYCENIKINGKQIEETAAAPIEQKINTCAAEARLAPSHFEIETAVAFLYFKDQSVDYAIIECGLGGRFDATNIIKKPALAVITSIGLDHTEMLGNTIEEIRWHKEGIIKDGCPFVRAEDIKDIEIKKTDITEQIFSYGGYNDLVIHLGGAYQPQNACLALEAAQKLGIERRFIFEGLARAEWRGRMTVIHKNPLFIVDGAHNPAGAEVLKQTVETVFKGKRIVFIIGIFRDKDADEMFKITAPLADKIIVLDMPENQRLYRAAELSKTAAKYSESVLVSVSPVDAVKKAFAAAKEDDVIISFGSLSTIDTVTKAVKETK